MLLRLRCILSYPFADFNLKIFLIHKSIIVDCPFFVRIDGYEIESPHELGNQSIEQGKSDVSTDTIAGPTSELPSNKYPEHQYIVLILKSNAGLGGEYLLTVRKY